MYCIIIVLVSDNSVIFYIISRYSMHNMESLLCVQQRKKYTYGFKASQCYINLNKAKLTSDDKGSESKVREC